MKIKNVIPALLSKKRKRIPRLYGDFTAYKLSVQRAPDDNRDYIKSTLSAEVLPTEIDYSTYVTVKDQGIIGSCGSHAACTALEFLDKMNSSTWSVPLSELFHYYEVRQNDYENTFPLDAGQHGRNAMQVMLDIGVSPESLCPYSVDKYNDVPGVFAYGFAKYWKIKRYERCFDAQSIKTALFHKQPVWIGIPVQKSIYNIGNTTLNYIPEEPIIGGHAVCIIGYSESRRAFRFVNSWYYDWGDRGFGWLGFDYLDLAPWFDAWTCVV